MLIYPAVDLMGGRCVRLAQGRFDDATEYDDDPHGRLGAFAASGAVWAHLVDLDGARAGAPAQHGLIRDLAAQSTLFLQAGGGVREADHVASLLQAGASRVVVGSAAVRRPQEVAAWLERFGPERLCLAFDVRPGPDGFEVAAHGWTEGSGLSLREALDLYPAGRLRHVLITDVSRDGMMSGPNLDLYAQTAATRPDLAIQASGGVADLKDLKALRAQGLPAAIIGRALYEGRFTLEAALHAG